MKMITIPFTPNGKDGDITEENVQREAEHMLDEDYESYEDARVEFWLEGEPPIAQARVTARVGSRRT